MFPLIKTIYDVYPAIEGCDEFKVSHREKDGIISIDYNVIKNETFPDFDGDSYIDNLYKIRRECRGIKFDINTKEIISRPYHKFFNLGERQKVEMDNIDWDKPFNILEKLDGSLIDTILINNKITYCTKVGVNDDISPYIQEFADRGVTIIDGEKTRVFYNDFCYDLKKSGYTPIFEWCSPKNKIVLEYKNDNLILTGIRKTTTGKYLDYEDMVSMAKPYRVPVVKMYSGTFQGINEFIEETKNKENEEGYVIRFKNGEMYKIKNLWYLQIHKTKEMINFEKDIWALCLKDMVDDIVPFMERDEANKLLRFKNKLEKNIEYRIKELKEIAEKGYEQTNGDIKKFSLEIVNKYPDAFKSFLFKIFNGYDIEQDIRNFALKNTRSSTVLSRNHSLFYGLTWQNFE